MRGSLTRSPDYVEEHPEHDLPVTVRAGNGRHLGPVTTAEAVLGVPQGL